MAFSLHNHCPCRVLCRVHTRLTTAPRIDASCTSTATCKSLCAWNFLSCLTFCWSASSFDKQVDSVKEHLTRTQTDSLFVCGLVTSKMLLWFGLYKSCHHSTATSLAKTQLPIAGSPEKALNFFFFWISHCQLCELWRPGGNIQRCLREQVSQRWNPEVRSRSYNRDTGAVLVQRAVRILHVEREVQRRKNKLGTGALRTFAWINCAEPGLIFFECAHAERERERERERVDRTYRWRKFRFQWLSRRSKERQESLEVQVRGAWPWSGKAHRSVSTSLERTDRGISLPSIFSQSAERPHEQRRMASKKEQLFALFFVAWITHFSHGKFFMGFRRAKSTQGNTNCQKNIFEDDQVPGHHPRAFRSKSVTLSM